MNSERRKFFKLARNYAALSASSMLPMDNVIFHLPTLNQKIGNASKYILLNVDLTGQFSFEGLQQVLGAQLAINEYNLKRNKKVALIISDNKCRSQDTYNPIINMIQKYGEDSILALTGGSSSVIANIQDKISLERKIILLSGVRQLYSIRNPYRYSTYLDPKIATQILVNALNNEDTLSITHNYSWGQYIHKLQRNSSDGLKKNINLDLNFSDHEHQEAMENTNFGNYKNIVVNIYGSDLSRVLKSIRSFKEADSRIILPLISDSIKRTINPELLTDVYFITGWSKQIESHSNKNFVNSFTSSFKSPPTTSAHQIYSQLSLFLKINSEFYKHGSDVVAKKLNQYQSENYYGIPLDNKLPNSKNKLALLVKFGNNKSEKIVHTTKESPWALT